jgi:hypothetical protein
MPEAEVPFAMAYSTFALLPLLLGILLLLVGVVLLKRGRWPRRVGTLPHCPKCDYILANLATTSRCPECGTPVSESTAIRGERRRRPALTATGGLSSLIGLIFLGLFLAGILGGIDWYRHKPLSWLIRDLDHTATAMPAWREIERRINASELSERNLGLLADRALRLQQSVATNVYDDTLFRLLGQRYADHKLTPAQEQQFFDGALRVRLEVRPVIGAQDPLPYWIHGVGRGPVNWWTRTRILEWRVDDGPPHRDQHGSGGSGSFGGWANGSSLASGQPIGKHKLHMKVELATSSKGSAVNYDQGPFDKIIVRDLEADLEVIPSHSPITTVTDPPAATLTPLITARLELSNSEYLNANFDVKPLPVNVAFEIFLRIAGKEYRFGGISFTKGNGSTYGTGAQAKDFPNPLPDKADIVLRSSETVARTTTNITQIWKGELALTGVKIQKFRPTTTAPVTNAVR